LRIFVCEFVTGGGFSGADLPAGLRREGDMMLRALVKDLSDLPEITVRVARDRRMPALDLPAEVCWIEPGEDPWPAWRRLIADADAVLPIAPETKGLLEQLSTLVLQSRRNLLASRPDAVRRAASKIDTAVLLSGLGIPTIPTAPVRSALDGAPPNTTAGWVVKPDDGAGSEETRLLSDRDELRRWAATRADIGRFVIQPYLPGRPTSLSLLCGDGRALVLSCNGQDVSIEGGCFRYRGGVVGGSEACRALYEPIAAQIAAAMPDLWGHVGVDLVETASGPVVLEVNPRMTTSYAGLRGWLGLNPATLLLQLANGGWDSVTKTSQPRQTAVRVHVDAA
jgi:predicted ATP-grasp superfamily ATP-dependent carboligase